jgi:hypothetical protein
VGQDRRKGQAGCDKTAIGDNKECTARKGNRGQDSQNITARTREIGQGNGDGLTVAGLSVYGIWDRTTEAGQPGHVNLDRSA